MPPHTAPHPRAAGLTHTILDDRYEVGRRLGEGGTSFVYLAVDTATGQQVAIKVLSPRLAADPDLLQRLRREAALVHGLEHPCLCRLDRLGESGDGLVYLVLEYLPGELLSDREAREGPAPLPLARSIVADLCAGLQHAHERGVIHRDLKPENVILVPDETRAAGVRAVALDFGLARPQHPSAAHMRLTATGVVLGTPEFMSPEQMRGRPVDARTDVYSMAILAFELLAGQLPFPGRTSQEAMMARLKGSPLPLHTFRPDLPAALGAVLARALAVDPADRHPGMAEFGAAFAAAADAPIDPPPLPLRSWWNRG